LIKTYYTRSFPVYAVKKTAWPFFSAILIFKGILSLSPFPALKRQNNSLPWYILKRNQRGHFMAFSVCFCYNWGKPIFVPAEAGANDYLSITQKE